MIDQTMEAASNSVTWVQLGVVGTVVVAICAAAFGMARRGQSAAMKEISDIRKALDDCRLENARTYATQLTLIEVERRLSASIDSMSRQMVESLSQMTGRFDELFANIIKLVTSPK